MCVYVDGERGDIEPGGRTVVVRATKMQNLIKKERNLVQDKSSNNRIDNFGTLVPS